MARRRARRGSGSSPAVKHAESAFASVPPGFEELLLEEISELGVRATVLPGGVQFAAKPEAIYAVNLWSRLAARVTLTLGQVRAPNLDVLAAEIRGLNWRPYIWPGQPIQVKVTLKKSKMRHKGTVEKKVQHAILDALKGPRLPGPRPPREAALVHLSITGERAEVHMDASGELLHRRGWRKSTAKAPLRENLAAGLLAAAGWLPGVPLVDPMCGSGTFCIEAAQLSTGRAAGARRSFAFERWPHFDSSVYKAQLKEAQRSETRPEPGLFFGYDRDSGAITASRDNAERARVSRATSFSESDFFDIRPPCSAGLMIVNPPYGERIGENKKIGRLYSKMGDTLRESWSGWRVGLLLPGARYAGRFGLKLEESLSFKNGGLPVNFFVGEIP